MRQARHPEGQSVRGKGDEEQGDPHVHGHPGGKEAVLRELDPHQQADVHGDGRLEQTEDRLIDQMRRHVGGNVHPGTVVALDDVPLPADHLNGVEAPVPDGDAGQGERAHEGPFHRAEEDVPDHHRHEPRDHGGHREHLPVVLINEHPEELSEVDRHLGFSPAVTDPHGFLIGPDSGGVRHNGPPRIS